MRFITVVIIGLLSMNEPDQNVARKAIYRPAEGSNVEYGQGAIERNDLPHAEVEPNVWFILVPEPGACDEWARKLNAAVESQHGSFDVKPLSTEEQQRVDRGEIAFQR